MDLGIDLLGGGIVGHVVLVDDSLHWEGVGWLPSQGSPQADVGAWQ